MKKDTAERHTSEATLVNKQRPKADRKTNMYYHSDCTTIVTENNGSYFYQLEHLNRLPVLLKTKKKQKNH